MAQDVELSVRQFIAAWRLMCGRPGGHTFVSADGSEYVFSGLPIAFFNVAVLDTPNMSADALRASVQRARGWASDKDVPWLCVLTHDLLEPGTDADAVLDDCSLGPMMPLTGMRATHVAPNTRIPDGLQLMRPADDEGCSAVVDVNALAYGMDLEAGKDLLGKQAFWQDHFPALGLIDGKPACAAAVMMIDGHRYVALVATDPAQQRRGYGDAAMRHALELAARTHGETPSILHATEAGRPVYERMGYEQISTHTIFMEKKYLNGA